MPKRLTENEINKDVLYKLYVLQLILNETIIEKKT